MKRIITLLILLSLTVTAFAINELQFSYDSNSNIYVIIRNPADSCVWNTAVTPAGWRAWNDVNITDYDIALTDESGSFYNGNFPTGIITEGTFSVNIYLREGSNPAITDILLGSDDLNWSGTEEVTFTDYATKQEIADTTVTTFDNNSLTTVYAKSAAVDANLYDTDAEYAAALWNAATASYGASGSYGLLFETNLDVAVSSRGTSNLIASDNIGLNWADIANPTTSVGLSATTIGTITTYTGNTPQTGDSFTIVKSGGSGDANAIWSSTKSALTDVNSVAVKSNTIISTGGEGPWTTGGTAQVDVNAIVNAIDANSIILNNIATKVNDLWLTNSGGFP